MYCVNTYQLSQLVLCTYVFFPIFTWQDFPILRSVLTILPSATVVTAFSSGQNTRTKRSESDGINVWTLKHAKEILFTLAQGKVS